MRALITALLAAVAVAEGERAKPSGGYNYLKGGEDWGTYYPDMENNICGKATSREQSPINLVTSGDRVIEDKDMDIEVDGLGANSVASRDNATT